MFRLYEKGGVAAGLVTIKAGGGYKTAIRMSRAEQKSWYIQVGAVHQDYEVAKAITAAVAQLYKSKAKDYTYDVCDTLRELRNYC